VINQTFSIALFHRLELIKAGYGKSLVHTLCWAYVSAAGDMICQGHCRTKTAKSQLLTASLGRIAVRRRGPLLPTE